MLLPVRRTARLFAEKQTVQNWIADSAPEMQAARLMTLHAAWVMDTQGASAARTDVALIKFYGAKVLHDVVDRALQLHGSLGYSTDLPLEQRYRFARAARIYDGPDEVHRHIGRAPHALTDMRPPRTAVPSEHLPTRRAEARERFAHLLERRYRKRLATRPAACGAHAGTPGGGGASADGTGGEPSRLG